MNCPDGLRVSNCKEAKLRGKGFLSLLPDGAFKDFNTLKSVFSYPQYSVLFAEKQTSRGLYMLCEGSVKLSMNSSEGKTLILRIAKPGDILGLTVVTGTPHELTAETIRQCRVAFVRRNAFLGFLSRHPDAYPALMEQLGAHYHSACEQLRTLALCTSATERLAKLLLQLSAGGQQTDKGTRVTLLLTHGEIAALIGTSRETVARTLSEFKSQKLAVIEGSTLLIHNRPALRSLVAA